LIVEDPEPDQEAIPRERDWTAAQCAPRLSPPLRTKLSGTKAALVTVDVGAPERVGALLDRAEANGLGHIPLSDRSDTGQAMRDER